MERRKATREKLEAMRLRRICKLRRTWASIRRRPRNWVAQRSLPGNGT
jgi:hypothetical protein